MARKMADRELKLKILECLIARREATTSHLIEFTEVNKKYKNSYAALTKPLEELRTEGVVDIKDEKLKESVGGPKSVYLIRKNTDAILELYVNYRELRENLYRSDWILDTLVNERFPPHFSKGEKGKLKRYLGASPGYFEQALVNNKMDTIVERWFQYLMSSLVRSPVTRPVDANGKRKALMFVYYDRFFEVCVFFDMMQGWQTERGGELLKERERLEYEQRNENERLFPVKK